LKKLPFLVKDPKHLAAGLWFGPVLFLLWLYSGSFGIWWRLDDFPLLGFVGHVHNFHDLLIAMFSPYAQGSIRPWSERLPFLLSTTVFANNPVPLRIAVFATAAGDVLLITWLTRRLTGSRIAAFAAPLFWVASAPVVSPMTWNSAYNEVQFPLFLLGALACFIRYAETGQRRYWQLQLAIFILGFGALETNVVYPVIAVVWVLCAAEPGRKKRLLVTTLPLFLISAAYAAMHLKAAPIVHEGPYLFRIDSGIWARLYEYWRWACVSPQWVEYGHSVRRGNRIVITTTITLIAFVVWQLKRKRVTVLFCLAWFVVTLGPMLPLPNRHEEYYLTAPVMGLAILAGQGVGAACNGGWGWCAMALLPTIAWFSASIPVVRESIRRFSWESNISENLVRGVQGVRRRNPGKAIFLDGVSFDLFRVAVSEYAFQNFGVDDVYLTDENGAAVHAPPDQVIDPAVGRHALEQNHAVVYDTGGEHLRDITGEYTLKLAARTGIAPQRVEMGNPLYGYLLGPEWMSQVNDARWMAESATVEIGGPARAGARLSFEGWCIDQQLRRGPLYVAISVDGTRLGEVQEKATHFQNEFALPNSAVGREVLRVGVRVHPTIRVGGQDYGALFSRFRVLEH